MIKINRVLISDDIDSKCVDLLRNNDVHVDLKPKMPKNELIEQIGNYDALLVRSATKVTADVLQAGAKNLKLVGRAGTGVDNIDVEQATRQGIVVMNTPAGNSRSAAELTCAMVMCLARHVPQAHMSMKQGKWDRKLYMGNEVYGKTLAIIGLGRIGRDVATRMQAFGMKTIGFDPIVSPEVAAEFGIDFKQLDEIWPVADYITVHVPLLPNTKDLINSRVLSQCKAGVKLINCARGGIINETDLIEALDNGHVAAAAFDVYEQEPPTNRALVDHPKVICTPHLGASTREAQQRVAIELAENIVALNQDNGLIGAVNAAPLMASVDVNNRPWLTVTENLTRIACALNPKARKFTISYPKRMQTIAKSLSAAVSLGYLKATGKNGPATAVNMLNAEMVADEITVKLNCQTAPSMALDQNDDNLNDAIDIVTETNEISGCPMGDTTNLHRVDENVWDVFVRRDSCLAMTYKKQLLDVVDELNPTLYSKASFAIIPTIDEPMIVVTVPNCTEAQQQQLNTVFETCLKF